MIQAALQRDLDGLIFFRHLCTNLQQGMKAKFLIFIILLSILLFHGCKGISKDEVSIRGTFTNLPGAKLYIYQLLPASKPLIDSVNTDASGNFDISIPVKIAGYYSLMHNAENEITLVVSPGEKIIITANGNSMRDTYSVEGSKDSKLYSEYNKFTVANLKKVDSLSRFFSASQSDPDFILVKKKLDSAYLEIFSDQKNKVLAFVDKHPNSLASLLVISENFGPNELLSEQTHPELFLKLDSTLFAAYPENSLVNTFHLRMLEFKAERADAQEHDKILAPGNQAPEIVLANSTGKEIKLSSMQGNLTLIYFWSSWNALSRQTNMNLTKIYNQYHDHGFEIYAISIDSDAELWKKSYLLDKAYWTQVNDPKGLESEYCKTYSVKVLPKMVLIGKDGKIIERNLVFRELEGLIKKNL